MHIDYLLVLDKIEIKRKILSNYWLKMSDVYIDPIGIAEKLVPKFFNKEKYAIHYENLKLYLKARIDVKKDLVYQNL